MEQRKLYISDLHLFHKNVTKAGRDFDKRPYMDLEEMHSDILLKWNQAVTNADHVFILGDFVWKFTADNRDEVMKMLKEMNGNLHLIIGNHDKIKDGNFKKRFEEIVHYKRVDDVLDGENRTVIMSHYYMPLYEQHYRGAILLHGHSHNSSESDMEREITELVKSKGFSPVEIYNIGCMYPYMDYTPRTLQEIVDGYHKYNLKNLRSK